MNAFLAILAVAVSPLPTVDFDTEVVPILTKAGCNAAACHGSAAGRGGFKLSLFGGDTSWDYDEIVYRLEGRRVNLARPETSLLISKPTEQINHEGGYRLEFEGPGATSMTRWIAEGARRVTARRLTRVTAEPSESLMALGQNARVSVSATFDDGTTRDVTKLAVYTAADPGAIEVDGSGGLKVLRRGRHTVVIRFLAEVLTIQLTVPLSDGPIDLAEAPRRNWIDDEVLTTLEALRVEPSAQANDARLLRRTTLHLTGRLPTPEAIRSYLVNEDPAKHVQLVDRLLDSSEFVDYWTYRLAKLLRIKPGPKNSPATKAFHFWVREQLTKGVGWDRIAAELLTAEGDTHEDGPANFYLVAGDARAQAEYVSELLMGVRLRCANCHNHPLDRWTQDDYHGLSAVFARVERGRNVRVVSRGEVIHPATGEAAVARVPGERFLDADADSRQEFANWLTDEENQYFGRAMVNRIWKALMGRGLIEPTDDLRATNPPTHPKLLDRIAEDFVANGHSIRHTIRLMTNSAAYARDSQATSANESDELFYSHALTVPLEAEVLADAIADVTGVAESYGEQPLGTRAITLFTRPESESLQILGRCDRADSCESNDQASGGLATKLHLLNGPLLNRRITDQQGRLRRLIAQDTGLSEIAEDFYLRGLGRLPTWPEVAYWLKQFDDASDREQMLEDFVWSLLNSKEFLTNH
ncbi:MAG: hypothetical protein CMJ64_09530 [Planctomycetaceae bacterium]|nr:hypothetical protein [Planctomycetaceae bacterium]